MNSKMIHYALLSLMLAACSAHQPVPANETIVANVAAQPPMKRAPMDKTRKLTACDSPAGIANLPYAHGHRFCSLDEYLAHLERAAAPIDQPWWKEIRPGVYQHMKTATNARPETATRAELLKRFGFSR